jgi:SAM-dependent methyltransferase
MNKNLDDQEQIMGNRKIFKESKLAHKYLDNLKGLEIGASVLNPFGLKTRNVGLKIENFIEADLRDTGKTINLDIIADSSSIPIPSESEDFILASHVIEHSPDFIKTLVEWYRIVKKNGIIFMIVHKRNSHKTDEILPVEDWRHFFRDYKVNATFEEEYENNYNLFGHYHRFTLDTFYHNVSRIFGKRLVLIDYQEKDDKVGNGFTLVFKKEISIKDAYPWKIICDDERLNIPKPADFYQLCDENKTANFLISNTSKKNSFITKNESLVSKNHNLKEIKNEIWNEEKISENKIPASKNEKIKTAYLIYGEDITSSGIIKNQVVPLLVDLSERENLDITLISMIRSNFEYSTEALKPILSIFRANNIKLAVAKIGDFNSTLKQLSGFVVEEDIKLIHCRSYISSQYAMEIKSKFGIPFIFDMRGLMPEEQKLFRDDKRGFELPIREDLKYQKHKILEKKLLENANSTIALNNHFKNYLTENFANIKRIDVINNFVNLNKFGFNPEIRNKIRNKMNWENKTVIVFSGSMSPWYDFSLLVSWLKQLVESGIDAILLLLTYIDKSSNIKHNEEYFSYLFKKNKLEEERLVLLNPKTDKINDFLCASDISVIPHKRRYEMILKVAQPIKFAEYLANGLPIISNNFNLEIVKTNLEYPFSGWITVNDKISENELISIKNYTNLPKNSVFKLREQITEIASNNFNANDVFAKYRKLYIDLLNK